MPERFDTDRPPHSRIFLTCHSEMTAEKLRESFGRFGVVEDLWQVRSLWYIKYSKSSSALSAIEEMNGKAIEEGEQPIKKKNNYTLGRKKKK
uniref:RRM domain-containing protein n=1 Tax=Romanomermis culicivorax TaxID=13658 RepID=A0A915JLL6_ROMCU